MEVVKNDAPKGRKRMSGAARRMRSKLYKSGDANNVAKSVNTDTRVARFIKQVEKTKSQNPKEDLAVVPVAASRKVKKDAKVQEAIKSQAFNIVRQKLVASLMQILPQSDGGDGGNWNNNNNQGQMRSRSNKNNNNNNNMNNGGWANNNNMNMNSGGFWSSSNNNNNNINRGGSNMQGGWNNNTNNNFDRGVSNSQGGWNNNNGGGRGVSNSSGIWSSNSNSNLNFNALNNMPNGWSNNQQRSTNMNNKNNNSNTSIWDAPCPEAPAPPPWNNNLSNSTLRNGGSLYQNQNVGNLGGGSGGNWNGSNYQSTSMWGQNKWSDDPRNAGGREYFQGQQLGNGNDNYFNDQQNVDEYEQSSAELKFAIMDMNMPNGKIVGYKRQELLQSAFNKALAEVVLNSDSRFPPIQIKFSRFIQDTYKISVASRRCAEVLQNLVDRLPSLWPGSKLRLVAFQPRVKLQKASVFIRSGAIGRTNEEIFLIIERQNAGLTTDKWHVFHKKEKDDGVLLILGIDIQSLNYLERNEGRVFFLTSNAIFRLGKKPVGAGPNGGTGNPKIKGRTGNSNPKGGTGNSNPKGGTGNSNPNGGTGNPSTQAKKSRKRKRSKK